jgi:membrane fusion protein, multidrug efflux system
VNSKPARVAPAFLVILIALATQTVLMVSPPAALAQPAPVITAPAIEVLDNVRITATGSGQAVRAAVLRPAAPGEVAEVKFEAGDRVQENEVLLRLVDRTQRLDVDLAESQLEAARQLMKRYRGTRKSGAVPGSVIDEARTRLRNAEIALEQAREALADRLVRAPFDGVVGIAHVMRGDRVTTESIVTTIDDRRVIRVAFAVPERYLGRLAVDQPVTVANVAFPGRQFDGRIVQIDSRVDLVSRHVQVLADVQNDEDLLRPGMSFEVNLDLPGERYPSVPQLALQWDGDGAFVWVLRGSTASRVPVRSVRRTRGRVLLAGDLQAGEQVVVEGVQRLRPGEEVRVIDTFPAGDPGSEASSPAAERPVRVAPPG